MKRIAIILMVFTGLFLGVQVAMATSIHPRLKTEDLLTIQVKSTSGKSRVFNHSDGYDEVIMDKVVEWINTSRPLEGYAKLMLIKNPVVKMEIKMKNGDIAFIEPAYHCISENQRTECSITEGEILYSQNNTFVRLQSRNLFDWLIVGWKYDVVGAAKNKLLEETLYSRYYPYLHNTFSDYIMCPRIDRVERINGNTRRHVLYISALNYSAHHGDVPYDKVRITLTDTPEKGVKINSVTVQKGISEKESNLQCKRDNEVFN